MKSHSQDVTMSALGPEELGQLVDRHAAPLELFAAQWADSPADVVQEAFIKLAAQAERPEQVAAWLYRVVRNAAISAARSANRRRKHEAAKADHRRAWFRSTDDDRLDAQDAVSALEALSAEHREVIVARLWGGLSFQEIASALDISTSTAHRHYEAGLQALRKRLGVPWLNNHI
jgi:RNA polymerase sigma-70 factor (ECF subfamily)